MKKLIIICLLALTYTNSYAQEPTKQETMDWIASKMRLYLVSNNENPRLFLEYSNGIFRYQKRIKATDGKSCGKIVYAINLNKVTSGVVYTHPYFLKQEITFEGKDVLIRDFSNFYYCEPTDEATSDNIELCGFSNEPYRKGGGTYDEDNLIFLELENGLLERFEKAFDVLTRYNTAKSPNEKF